MYQRIYSADRHRVADQPLTTDQGPRWWKIIPKRLQTRQALIAKKIDKGNQAGSLALRNRERGGEASSKYGFVS